MLLTSLLSVLILCLTHIFVNKLKLSGIPRSKWLSIAGGISVTYIFLQSFPELQEFQREMNHRDIHSIPGIVDLEIYFIALLGLTFFYGLENKTKKSVESERRPDPGKGEENIGMFWIHISSFAIYNFIIAYLLLHMEEVSKLRMITYTIAMSFHLIVTDHSLEDHFKKSYKYKGRWILVAALFLGWLTSLWLKIPEIYLGMIFAFIAGGIIMNVLKEELPRERDSNLLAFCLGVFFYSLILIFI